MCGIEPSMSGLLELQQTVFVHCTQPMQDMQTQRAGFARSSPSLLCDPPTA
jgi:hypothetical protein